jgi:hypothetical protein
VAQVNFFLVEIFIAQNNFDMCTLFVVIEMSPLVTVHATHFSIMYSTYSGIYMILIRVNQIQEVLLWI